MKMQARRRRIAILILATIALLSAGYQLLPGSDRIDENPVGPTEGASPQLSDAGGTEEARKEAAMGLPSRPVDLSGWPQNGQSMVERWALLAPMARAGHVEAACRLGREIRTCVERLADDGHLTRSDPGSAKSDLAMLVGLGEHIEDWQSELRDIEDNRRFDAEMQEMRRKNFALQLELRGNALAQCQGLTEEQLTSAPRWLRMAVDRGSPDAMVAYLELATLWRKIPGAYHDPEFQRWRLTARPIAQRLLSLGDTRAPHAISELEETAGRQLLGAEPHRMAAARRVREWLASEPSARRSLAQPTPYEDPMTPAEARAVSDLAQKMAANYRADGPKAELAWGIDRWDTEQSLCTSMVAR